MQQYLQEFVDIVLKFRSVVGDFFGPRLYVFEILSLIISGLLVWGIIYTASQSNYLEKRIEDWIDYLGYGDVGRRRQLRSWKAILKKMRSAEQGDWKASIIEADRILDDIIRSAGFRSTSADERFRQIPPTFVSNYEDVQAAHKVRNRCAQEPDFALAKEEAIRVLRVYKKAFQEFGLLD